MKSTVLRNCVAGLISWILGGQTGLAAPGDLDQSFAHHGRFIGGFGRGSDDGTAVVVRPDGKVLVAGSVRFGATTEAAVYRFLADGSRDLTFGIRGKAVYRPASGNCVISAMAVQPDGRIVVAGVQDQDYLVVRWTANGTLDTSFSGDGFLKTNISGRDEAMAVAVQTDGKIVVAGSSVVDPGTGANQDFSAVRYHANGSLDTSFSGDGKVITAVATPGDSLFEDDGARAAVIQPDGKIMLAGFTELLPPHGPISAMALVRYLPNGDLDPSFDGNGKLAVTAGTGGSGAWAMAFQAGPLTEQRILVAGFASNSTGLDPTLIRLRLNGTMDTSFDGNGMLGLDSSMNGTFRAVAVSYLNNQANGIFAVYDTGGHLGMARYLMDGTADSSLSGDGFSFENSGGSPRGAAISGNKMVVVGKELDEFGYIADIFVKRYLANGALDPSFHGDGRLLETGSEVCTAGGVALQPDGKIVLSGTRQNAFGALRFLADGTPDPDFARSDTRNMEWDLEDYDDTAGGGAVALQSDGKIIVAGYRGELLETDFAVIRCRADGTLDPAFNRSGKVVTSMGSTSFGRAVAVQADGRIVVAGSSGIGNSQVALVRYTASGALDESFGFEGRVFTQVSPGGDAAMAAAVQPGDGKIVVAGYATNGSHTEFALVRYLPDGNLDDTFGGDGIVTTPFPANPLGGNTDSLGRAMVLLPDGAILVAGYSQPNGGDKRLAVARYLSNGSLDNSFSGDGRLTAVVGSGDAEAYGLALQGDGKFLVAGTQSGLNNGTDVVVLRYLADGTPDNGYGQSGRSVVSLRGTDGARGIALAASGAAVVAAASDDLAGLIRLSGDTAPSSALAYSGWVQETLAAYPAEQQAFTADPDNDGIPNGLEYAAMTDPASMSGSVLQAVPAPGGGGIYLTYPQNRNAAGIVWGITASATLAGPWMPAEVEEISRISGGGQVDIVTVRPLDLSAGAMFYLLKIDRVPP